MRPGHPGAGLQVPAPLQPPEALPAVASVALQQGNFAGKNILRDIRGKPRRKFRYFDRGKMATIGKSKAIVERGSFKFGGFFAWVVWLIVHIWFLSGFQNRLDVFLQWAWVYIFHRHGARIITERDWRLYDKAPV